MRCNVPFSAVSNIVPVTGPDIDLPRNIAVATGADRMKKREDAIRLLANDPDLNAVIMIEEQRGIARHALDILSSACQILESRSVRIKQLSPVRDMQETLRTYFAGRTVQHVGETGINKTHDDAAVLKTAPYILSPVVSNILEEVKDIPGYMQSAMTYANSYFVGRMQSDYINTHTDQMRASHQYTMREVEVAKGSGTVLFMSDDFEIEGEIGKLARDQITCWSILSGSSVLLRTLGTQDPSIHAHGISDGISPEQRLTFRHDFKI